MNVMQIEIKNLSKSYGKHRVLKDVCLSAAAGTCIGILGTNGSGKSTLLSILAGTLSRTGGAFLINGEDAFENTKTRNQLVGFVPQGTPLIDELSARDNLLLWYDRATMKQELENGVLKLLGIPDFIKVPARKMSGGMKKRLSIGCAMATKPPILLLDEPTAALDLACKQNIAEYLQKYRQAGGIILLATHDERELSMCDRLYILKNGVLQEYVHTGDMHQLVNSL